MATMVLFGCLATALTVALLLRFRWVPLSSSQGMLAIDTLTGRFCAPAECLPPMPGVLATNLAVACLGFSTVLWALWRSQRHPR
jgi:hypothetical protein